MTNYASKPITSLTDRQLALAETDVANCLARVNAAPSGAYQQYKASLEQQAAAIDAEKEKRA
jgi:hypothetical protein